MDWFVVCIDQWSRNINKMWNGSEWVPDPGKAKVYNNMKAADDAARDLGPAKAERADHHRKRLMVRPIR